MNTMRGLSLRTFHLVFILIAIAGADLFGAWAINTYKTTHDPMTLVLGIVSFVGGLGLVGYALWVVNKMDRGHIE